MATVLYSRTRLATYLPGLNALVQRIASTMDSSRVGSYGSGYPNVPKLASLNEALTLQNDETMGPFDDKDQLYFMPGNIGLESHLQFSDQRTRNMTAPELRITSSASERCMPGLLRNEIFDVPVTNHSTNTENQDFANSCVECVIQSCPEKLKKDLQNLFPEAPNSDVTVITVSHKTKNDMTAWSSAVEEERAHLLDKFVEGAKKICFILQKEGFWADFIDPSSGLAFFGPYTNNTLFETDDRYRLLGFQIEDLGCCRVIRHPLWGTHAFVGIIFNNAPPNSLIMKNFQGF
ncbi:cobalamin trafficking protein CblD isoform X1 [Corythoichthys intestinalis]|uniref:cobalamin trafficking protein CblD isoform X1 n=1 Tax=Corythoichthys intestinalis TaxID=161448 RepID=UPI0025A58E9A|nr:metabolism of cobalamin associated Db isoform X1 [Corythoichthys intestinalis]